MKNLRTTTAILFASIATTPAFAGGLAEPVMQPAPTPVMAAPAPQPMTGWGGFYAGGQIGTISADTSALVSDYLTEQDVIDLQLDPSILNDTIDAELDGKSYGLHIGYMYDLGSFVMGAELDYDVIEFDDVSATFEGVTVSESVEEDASIARLKLRAGYNAGRFLPYATAGVARLESDSENTNGTFFGAGVAIKATENFLVGGEVLQHQFDDAFDTGLDIEATTLSLRASYRF